MSLAKKVNGGNSTVRNGIDTKDLAYVKAGEIAFQEGEDEIILAGFFFQEGKYGKSVTLVTDDGRGVNIPSWYVKRFESYTPEEIEEIKAGKLKITSIDPEYQSKNGVTTLINFADVED